jgi:hypothetical protein
MVSSRLSSCCYYYYTVPRPRRLAKTSCKSLNAEIPCRLRPPHACRSIFCVSSSIHPFIHLSSRSHPPATFCRSLSPQSSPTSPLSSTSHLPPPLLPHRVRRLCCIRESLSIGCASPATVPDLLLVCGFPSLPPFPPPQSFVVPSQSQTPPGATDTACPSRLLCTHARRTLNGTSCTGHPRCHLPFRSAIHAVAAVGPVLLSSL